MNFKENNFRAGIIPYAKENNSLRKIIPYEFK